MTGAPTSTRPDAAATRDFELPGEDDPRRIAVRAWLREHPEPTGRELAEAGYVAPHWPRPWGLAADPAHQLIINDELRRARVKRPKNLVGLNVAGPTLIHVASPAQQERFLPPLLSGEEIWCQLFSEPDAGSDLASLRTRAVRDGDSYVVRGHKVWTSWAHVAKFAILLARTSPDLPKRQGISYFICPMDLPGIEVRPLIEMTGGHVFNEVFLDDVRIPAEYRLGEENAGWQLARLTLANERVSLSREGAIWGDGPSARELIDLVRRQGGCADAVMRQRLAGLFTEAEVLRLTRLRVLTAVVRGAPPGPEASIRKAMSDVHGQRIMQLAKDLAGAQGMIDGSGPLGTTGGTWSWGFLFSPALTIGGGTAQIQRNVIAEKILGLPADPGEE